MVEALPEIDDSLAVGQKWDNDERVILFVKLVEGEELTEELKAKIRRTIRENVSPRHVPAKIIPDSGNSLYHQHEEGGAGGEKYYPR